MLLKDLFILHLLLFQIFKGVLAHGGGLKAALHICGYIR